MKCLLAAFLVLSVFLLPVPCPAQKPVEEKPVDDDRMVRDAGNPVTSLVNLPVQDNIRFGLGEFDRTSHIIKIQPVRISFQAGKPYKIRSRSIIPFIYAPDLSRPSGGTFGLGDITLMAFFSPSRLGDYIWGAGPVIQLPTATDDILGTGKWSAGVSGVVATQRKNWIAGAMVFNIWSFAGKEDRTDVNRMQLDVFCRYHIGNRWILVSSPTVTADWQLPDGEQWLVPVGGGIGRIWLAYGHGVGVEAQAFYNVIHPDRYPFPDWTFRFQVQYVGLIRRNQ